MKNLLLLAGGAAAVYLFMSKKAPTTQYVNTLPQTTKAPASAQAQRADQGNQANQPWYMGAAQVASSINVNDIVNGIKSIADIFKSNDNIYDYDYFSTDNNDFLELAGDFGSAGGMDSDYMYDTGFDGSGNSYGSDQFAFA